MAKNLIIVESPAKTKTLSRFLGKDYDILATVGHVADLPKSRLGVDPDKNFLPEYHVIKGKEKIIAQLKKAAKKASHIYLAPDPDREGEAIAWHVAQNLKINGKTTIQRVTFNEITKSAVIEALKNPREIDLNLFNAQQARRILDRIVGYTVSPFLWATVARNLSAGRVQSVTLRIICEREEAVTAFNPEEYWQIRANLDTMGRKKEQFEARLHKIDEQTVVKGGEKGKNKIVIGSKKEADSIVKELKKKKYVVGNIKRNQKTRRPLPPFITSTLQQEAAKVYGFAPRQTMSVAQKLYEGIEIGNQGQTGLITYMRTDSTRIAGEALTGVRKYIEKTFGKQYLPPKANVYARKKASQDAHEAIRPTYLDLPPAKVKKNLTAQQVKLYTLIWNRFLASQMKPALFDVESVDIIAGRFVLRASAQRLKFDGFLKIYREGKEVGENGDDENGFTSLPELTTDDPLKLVEIDPNQSFTKPPPRFSESMLVKELEADGIGRPSTYASIITTLKDRQYVDLKERKLHPTDLGVTVNKILVENFPDLFNVKFTANMERDLDKIEEGQHEWATIVQEFYGPFMKTIKKLKGKEKQIKASLTEKTKEKCDKCGSAMVIKWGRNGRFLACSAYPECRSTRPLAEEAAKSKTDEKCDKCGSAMVIKSGRFGRFLACSAYPDCKTTKRITLGIDCTRDDCKGQLVEKLTRGRKVFYGCSKYPDCDYASWDMPVKVACNACKHPFMVAKTSKAKGDFYRCPECGEEVAPASTEAATATG